MIKIPGWSLVQLVTHSNLNIADVNALISGLNFCKQNGIKGNFKKFSSYVSALNMFILYASEITGYGNKEIERIIDNGPIDNEDVLGEEPLPTINIKSQHRKSAGKNKNNAVEVSYTSAELLKNFKLRLLSQDRASSGCAVYFPIRLFARLCRKSKNAKIKAFPVEWATREALKVKIYTDQNNKENCATIQDGLQFASKGVTTLADKSIYSFTEVGSDKLAPVEMTALKYLHIDHEPMILEKLKDAETYEGLATLTKMLKGLYGDDVPTGKALKELNGIIFADPKNPLPEFMDEELLLKVISDVEEMSKNMTLQLVIADYNLAKKGKERDMFKAGQDQTK